MIDVNILIKISTGPNGQDLQQGVIPNSAAAEELATAQFNAAKKEAATLTSENRGSFFRRRRATHRRSKSLGRVRHFHQFNFHPFFSSIFDPCRITGTMWCLPRRSANSRPTSGSSSAIRDSSARSSSSDPSPTWPAINSSKTFPTSSPLPVRHAPLSLPLSTHLPRSGRMWPAGKWS